MAEWRTQEQIDADDALQTAIAASLLAYSDNPDNHQKFMLTEYIVIAARVGITDDKAQNTQYDYVLSNGSIPRHNMMGLMRWAEMSMEESMRGSKEDD